MDHMERWRLSLGFLFYALLPPAGFSAVTIAAHACRTHSLASTALLLLVLPPVLYGIFCRHRKNSPCSDAPAYAPVLGHFATAFLTHIVKLFPVVSAGLSTFFVASSLGLAFLLKRMIVSDPGHMASLPNKIDHPWRKYEKHEDYRHFFSQFCTRDLLEQADGTAFVWRGKDCHYCHAFIQRYDHHCAAVQNCIGRRNHGLFVLLLLAFSSAEISYVLCCISYLRKFLLSTVQRRVKGNSNLSSDGIDNVAWEIFSREAWVFSTASFVGFQVFWQIPFLIFHAYLIAINLTTDEWVNWEKYPRFHKETLPSPGSSYHQKKFVNPYDQGFLGNLHAMIEEWK